MRRVCGLVRTGKGWGILTLRGEDGWSHASLLCYNNYYLAAPPRRSRSGRRAARGGPAPVCVCKLTVSVYHQDERPHVHMYIHTGPSGSTPPSHAVCPPSHTHKYIHPAAVTRLRLHTHLPTWALPVHRPPVWMSSTVMSKSSARRFTPAARSRPTTALLAASAPAASRWLWPAPPALRWWWWWCPPWLWCPPPPPPPPPPPRAAPEAADADADEAAAAADGPGDCMADEDPVSAPSPCEHAGWRSSSLIPRRAERGRRSGCCCCCCWGGCCGWGALMRGEAGVVAGSGCRVLPCLPAVAMAVCGGWSVL